MDAVRTIEIDAEAEAQLREIAAERGLEPREMVEGFIAEEAAMRARRRDGPVAPGTAYPATPVAFLEKVERARRQIAGGRSVSGPRADRWLASWAAGERPDKLAADGS